MSQSKVVKNQPADGAERTSQGSQTPSKREVSQVTLSTIGDLSMAATNSIDRVNDARRPTCWLPILGFLLLVYIATCFATLYSLKSDPKVRAFLTPIFPAIIATLTFWWRQRWKLRARGASLKMRAWQNAFGSLSHEATSATNAIRANLTGFLLADPQASQSEHLRAIELATARIGNALQKSSEMVTSKN